MKAERAKLKAILMVVAGAVFAGTNPAEIATTRDTSVKWVANGYRNMKKVVRSADLAKIDTVFIGDSITRHWTNKGQGAEYWSKSFPNAVNFGMGGDRTEHVLFRLKSEADGGLGLFDSKQLQPKTIILMIGTNNLFSHDAAQITGGVKAVVARLRKLRPNARLILCSVLPTHNLSFNTKKVTPVNKAIQLLKGIEWLDLYSFFAKEDRVTRRKELYKDGLHLNAAGYKLWHDLLIAKLRKEP